LKSRRGESHLPKLDKDDARRQDLSSWVIDKLASWNAQQNGQSNSRLNQLILQNELRIRQIQGARTTGKLSIDIER